MKNQLLPMHRNRSCYIINIEVKIPKTIKFGDVLRVRSKGVPVGGNRRGDLLIKVDIELPTKLSRKAKRTLDDLREEGI